jgi:hypothetical protein
MPVALSISEWTSVVSTLAAALAATFSAVTIHLTRKLAIQQRAAQAMFQYLDLSLRYPKLSTTKPGEDYEWYVFSSLMMAREVLAAYPNDKSWREQVKVQLAYHWTELQKWPPDVIGDFGNAVATLVAEVVRNKGQS